MYYGFLLPLLGFRRSFGEPITIIRWWLLVVLCQVCPSMSQFYEIFVGLLAEPFQLDPVAQSPFELPRSIDPSIWGRPGSKFP